ncbi:hypothetical protein HXX76_013435 [Chlamydomonas incerta]|uniref:ABC transporter domain-containing protein n=1 Tax=Chlamydomonas incerta TaxID=51695 RepID=A0A835SSE3_CHLIN|nr:hypothetical protein HXX76_013435 [Chlamydomonas incerta]|eukprot:KAG2425810.1 hypothetical protein HXX76_013435 [Chlamydomonas incerta]
MVAASFGAQANALLRKSATYQKRNVRTNICLLSSPIFFCLLLLFIRILVNKVFLTGPDFECGCQCLSCCKNGTCEKLTQGFCDTDAGYTCTSTNSSACGIAYSSPQQSAWCSIPNPSTWPPVLQTPTAGNRAPPYKPAVTTMVTAPQGGTPGQLNASKLVPGIYTVPLPMTNTTFLNEFLPNLIMADGTVNAHLFSQWGFTFGTAAEGGQNQYIERAFASESTLNFLLPNIVPGVNCSGIYQQIGVPQAALPLINIMMGVVYITTNTLVTQDQVDAVLEGRPVIADFLDKKTVCSDIKFAIMPNDTAIDDALYCGYYQARCNGSAVTAQFPPAFEFPSATGADVDVTIYYNATFLTADSSGNGRDSYNRVQLPLSGGVMSWYSEVFGFSALPKLLGVMSMPKMATKLKLDFSNLLGPLFYTWVVQMLLPTFLQQLVYEKEKRLRMMMKMHGLGDGAYWLITYLWYLILYVIYMIIFMVFGAGVGLEIFRRTSIGIQIIFYFLFGNNMIAFSFVLSSLFGSSRTSTVVAFIYVFATGLIGELLLKVFMEKDAGWVFFIEWIPAFALYRGLWEMAEYAFLGVYRDERGLTWERMSDPGNGMYATWGIFVVEWFIFMALGWYLEQVLSSGNGIRRHPLYFLECCMGRNKKKHDHAHGAGSPRSSVEMGQHPGGGGSGKGIGGDGSLKIAAGEREDVKAERLRVEHMSEAEAAQTPIVVRDLRKVYPPQDGGKPKVAVRTLTMAIERGECFGLLGPNGAGKSTSINMLTGFLEPSGGTASVEGLDIRTAMSAIYANMGVCPQHDLLWEQLTGEEHLLFYGRLKGLKGAELLNAVTAGLRSVNLFNGGVGNKQAQKYSGGMKRRLSVAISFIGQPKVVYLDEPSTGLDPASRRNLWEVVRSNKSDRAIILTTHSMEEAEILCDRLGIFVDGQLVCIGNPREITSRYAGYLVFTLTVAPGHEGAAKAFVAHMSPNARLTYELGTTVKYELPTADVSLARVFDAMATAKTQMQVLDWGVANATLEEVFIKFAREIGAETEG